MARLLTLGFEVQKNSASPATYGEDDHIQAAGTPTYTTVGARTGAALSIPNVVNTYVMQELGVAQTLGRWYYMRFYWKIPGTPTGSARPWQLFTTANTAQLLVLEIGTARTVRLLTGAAGTQQAISAALTANTWYRFEVGWRINAAGNSDVIYRIDGVDVFNGSVSGMGNVAHGQQRWGLAGNLGGIAGQLFDDIAINDDQGSNENSWPGPGSIYMLKPASDSARANWVAGAAGTTSLFNAVKNTPPVGVATASATITSQIRNAISGTASYDAVLDTYTAAGIASTDTIKVVQPLFRVGAGTSVDITGTFRIVSNPADAGDTTLTTFRGAAAAAGSEPTGWKTVKGNVTYLPTVTKGTGPVLRITKTAANTNIAMVDFMGLIVEATPDVTLPVTTVLSGPTLARISAQTGKDSSDFVFEANEDIQAYKVKVVAAAGDAHTTGTQIESGGAKAAGEDVTINITQSELATAGGAEGNNIVKVFTQDLAGNWSA